MDVDVEAELKSLQASIAQLQTENLGGMKDFSHTGLKSNPNPNPDECQTHLNLAFL